MNDVSYSQNFIAKKDVVARLIKDCRFSPNDLVLDIGSGKGAISRELVKYSNNVEAIEIEKTLADTLKNENIKNLKVLNYDFFEYRLPRESFKVFSNIPFNKTADILKRLLNSKNFAEGYLIVQKEAAYKFGGEQLRRRNTLLSVIFGSEFKFTIVYSFRPEDFKPTPNVDIVLMRIKRREHPLVSERSIFRDFMAYMFGSRVGIEKIFSRIQLNRLAKDRTLLKKFMPSDMKIAQFITLFNLFSMNEEKRKRVVFGEYEKMKYHEEKIEKVNRTRLVSPFTKKIQEQKAPK